MVLLCFHQNLIVYQCFKGFFFIFLTTLPKNFSISRQCGVHTITERKILPYLNTSFWRLYWSNVTSGIAVPSVADPDHFDTDPDPAFIDPDPLITLIQIQIRPFYTDPDLYWFKEVIYYLKQYFLSILTWFSLSAGLSTRSHIGGIRC